MPGRRMQVTLATALLLACSQAPSNEAQAQAGAANDAGRPFTVTPVADFDTPWAMSFLPGSGVPKTNMALVSERYGRLWLVDATSGERQAVSGVPSVVVAGQGGLGDVVPAPDFAGSRRVYLTFVEAGEGGTSGAALAHATLEMGQGEPRLTEPSHEGLQSPMPLPVRLVPQVGPGDTDLTKTSMASPAMRALSMWMV